MTKTYRERIIDAITDEWQDVDTIKKNFLVKGSGDLKGILNELKKIVGTSNIQKCEKYGI